MYQWWSEEMKEVGEGEGKGSYLIVSKVGPNVNKN